MEPGNHSTPRENEPERWVEPYAVDRTARHLNTFPRYAVLLSSAVIVLSLDQVLKAIVVRSLAPGEGVEVAGGLVRIDFARNTGAAFGTFQSGGVLLIVVAVVASAGILVFYQRIARSTVAVRIALGLVLGGALGNLMDRLRLGYVVDYVDLRWWYVFNLADSAIVLGVAILVFGSHFQARHSSG